MRENNPHGIDEGPTAEEMYMQRVRNYRGPTRNNESQAAGMKEAFKPNYGVRYADPSDEMQGAPYEDRPKVQNRFSKRRYREMFARESLRSSHVEQIEAQRQARMNSLGPSPEKRAEERHAAATGMLMSQQSAREKPGSVMNSPLPSIALSSVGRIPIAPPDAAKLRTHSTGAQSFRVGASAAGGGGSVPRGSVSRYVK